MISLCLNVAMHQLGVSCTIKRTGVLFSNDVIDFFVVIPVAVVVKGQKVSYLTSQTRPYKKQHREVKPLPERVFRLIKRKRSAI